MIVRNFERLLAGFPATVRGDGRQTLDYVYVDDVVEATVRAMEADVSGEVLNVGSGRGTEIRALLEEMADVAEAPRALEPLPADETAGTSRVADVGRIAARLGWRPRTSLADGLGRTLSWMREQAGA